MNHLRMALEETGLKKGWVGVDLDGTLAYYNSGDGVAQIGPPIEKMVAFVKHMLDEGIEVRIMTARVGSENEAANEAQREMITKWTESILGQALAVTCKKDPGMIVLYDDRAIQVISNMGEIVEA